MLLVEGEIWEKRDKKEKRYERDSTGLKKK